MYEKRLGRLLLAFVALLVLIGAQAFRLQVLQAGGHVARLDDRLRRTVTLLPRRGDILDAAGRPLAADEPACAIHVNLRVLDARRTRCAWCGHLDVKRRKTSPRPEACGDCGAKRGLRLDGSPRARDESPDAGAFDPPGSEPWRCTACDAVTLSPVPELDPLEDCPACGREEFLEEVPGSSPAELALILGKDPAVLSAQMDRVRRLHRKQRSAGHFRYELFPLLPRVDRENARAMALAADRFPGLEVEPVPGRFVEPSAASVVGLIQPPGPEHVERFRDPSRAERGEHVYTLRELMRSLIGVSRLEGNHDTRLRGVPGLARRLRTEGGELSGELEILRAVQDGETLRTTLRLPVQALAHDIVESAPSDAAVVVLDLRDGGVVAIDSKSGDGFHHAVTHVQPGSVFKLITALAFLESGGDPDETLPCRNRGTVREGLRYRCDNHAAHDADLMYAFARSCNYYFMHRAGAAGPDAFADACRRLGIDRSEQLDLKGSRAGLEVFPGEGRKIPRWDVEHMGWGQGRATATPLQIATAYARVATGGRMLEPHLLQDPAGAPRPVPAIDPVIARHAPLLKTAARLVVTEGTGRKSEELARVRAAGKSGTGEVPRRAGDPGDPERNRYVNNAWFVGYAPYDDPKYLAVVVYERVLDHGGDLCGPLVGRLLEEALLER